MGEQFKGIIPYAGMTINSKVLDFYTMYSEFKTNVLIASLMWDGFNSQLYLLPTEDTEVGPIHVAFDGYVNTESASNLHFLNVPAGQKDILPVGDPYYFFQEGVLNGNNKIIYNNSFLRINNCSLYFGNFQGGLMFDMNCQYNGTPEFGGLTIMGNYDETFNPPNE